MCVVRATASVCVFWTSLGVFVRPLAPTGHLLYSSVWPPGKFTITRALLENVSFHIRERSHSAPTLNVFWTVGQFVRSGVRGLGSGKILKMLVGVGG